MAHLTIRTFRFTSQLSQMRCDKFFNIYASKSLLYASILFKRLTTTVKVFVLAGLKFGFIQDLVEEYMGHSICVGKHDKLHKAPMYHVCS